MHTEIYTYFTNADGRSKLLYSAEGWVRIELALETAGPVSVGTRENLTPVLTGLGILLEPDGEPVEFVMPKGDRLYIAAESINRVKFIVEPIPWLQQILGELQSGFGGIKGIMGAALRRKKAPAPQKGDPDCPPKLEVPNIFRGR